MNTNFRQGITAAVKTTLFTLSLLPAILGTFSCRNPLQDIIERDIAPKTSSIVVLQGATELPNGSGSYNFGAVQVGTTVQAEFTITNSGEGTLTLSGDPQVALGGTDAADFSVTSPPGITIEAGASTVFTLSFSPAAATVRNSQFSIANNDAENTVYTVSLTGAGTDAPQSEITVTQNSLEFASGSTFNFGGAVKNSAKDISFVVNNTGQGNLTLSGDPKVAIAGPDAAAFSVPAPPSSPVLPGGSSTFTVRLNSPSVGPKSAAFVIASNDADEGSYGINLTANVTATAEPDINIKQGSDIMTNGVSTYTFADTLLDQYLDIVFTIENNGTLALNLQGNPSITLGGANPDQFSIQDMPAAGATIPYTTPSSSDTFTLRFQPTTTLGDKTATVTIPNDDPDESPFTFTITGEGVQPDINVKQGTTDIADSGSYDIPGQTVIGSYTDTVFTIENTGTAPLTIGSITRTGTDYLRFTIVAPMYSSPVAPGGSTTFTVRFTPTTSGAKTAILHINNSDPTGETPYDITINGTAVVGPEMNVKQNTTSYADGGPGYTFPDTLAGEYTDVVFTIENTGGLELTLDGTPKVAISGTDADKFVVTSQPTSPVAPSGGSTTFTIRFTPGTVDGEKTAALSIANTDADEDPYNFPLSGEGVAPEIEIDYNLIPIPDGTGSHTFADTLVGSSTDVLFYIRNYGGAGLNLTGTPPNYVVVGGTHSSQFSVFDQPSTPIPGHGYDTFTVRFTPASAGEKEAWISIANDDSDENPYNFAIYGEGLAPEINIKQGTTDIPDGTGSYPFADTNAGSYTDVQFTIENTGSSNLILDGSPNKVALGGTNPDQFIVTVQPASPVAGLGSTTFTLRFAPTTSGGKSATVSIENNDAGEDPYNFTVTGTALGPEINVKQGTTDIPDGTGSYAYVPTTEGSYTDIVFTIENTGNGNLILDGTPKVAVGGTNPDQFIVTVQPASPVAGSGSTTFTLRFAPTSFGGKSATVSIDNNDANENPYDFAVTGTGLGPEMNLSRQGFGPIPVGGNCDFGSTAVGGAGVTVTFVIFNDGSSGYPLQLTGTPKVQITMGAGAFAVVPPQPTTPIPGGGGSVNFQIKFAPISTGSWNGSVSIPNDDFNENPYTFTLSGTGTE